MTKVTGLMAVTTIFSSLSVTRSTKLGTIPERLCTRRVRAWVPLLLSREPEKVHYRLWIEK